jgi:hypothetical protein
LRLLWSRLRDRSRGTHRHDPLPLRRLGSRYSGAQHRQRKPAKSTFVRDFFCCGRRKACVNVSNHSLEIYGEVKNRKSFDKVKKIFIFTKKSLPINKVLYYDTYF